MKDGLKDLILYIAAAIDSGENEKITLNDIKQAVNDRRIFEYLISEVESSRTFNANVFKNNEKEHLELHWKSHLIDWDFENKFGINKKPLCVFLALVALSIQ